MRKQYLNGYMYPIDPNFEVFYDGQKWHFFVLIELIVDLQFCSGFRYIKSDLIICLYIDI